MDRMSHHIVHKDGTNAGFILLPVLLLMLVLAFAVLLVLNDVFSNSVIGSQSNAQSNMRDALSIGAEQASAQLNSYTNWPEIITDSGSTLDGYQSIASNVYPTQPTSAFWSTCAANNECVQNSINLNGVDILIQWTIMPSNGYAKRISGYAYQSGGNGPTQRNYIAFVRVQSPSGQQSMENIILKKSLL